MQWIACGEARLVGDRLDAEEPALHVGVARELGCGRLDCDLATDHDELPLCERGRDVELLLDEENREPLLLERS